MLGNIQKTDLDKLAKLLCSENNGKIKYLPFLIFLRTLTLSIHEINGKNNENFGSNNYDSQLNNKHNNCRIIEQLINNCVDKNYTLYQLRKYFVQNVKNKNSYNDNDNDNDNNFRNNNKNNDNNFNNNTENNDENKLKMCEITIPELVKLFKHFDVLFDFQNFSKFITNIGLFPSTKNKNNTNFTELSSSNRYNDTYMSSRGIRKNTFNDFENTNNTEFSKFENKSINGKILLKKILEVSKMFQKY